MSLGDHRSDESFYSSTLVMSSVSARFTSSDQANILRNTGSLTPKLSIPNYLSLGLRWKKNQKTKKTNTEICFWYCYSITRTIDFLLALVFITIPKAPCNIGTIEYTLLLFF